MDIEAIRTKYRQILDDPDLTDSEDEYKTPGNSRIMPKKNQKVLTESNALNTSTAISQCHSVSDILPLKEKIAQCLANLKKKDEKIANLEKELIKKDEATKLSEKYIMELKREMQQTENRIVSEKIAYGTLEKEQGFLCNTIKSLSIDKELLEKQMIYYKQEIHKHKEELRIKDKQQKDHSQQFKKQQQLKNDNYRLREDIKRLHFLLNESMVYGKLGPSIQRKHFLGKPCREMECWFPENLVGEVELFLKKQQIAHGNKEFTASLIKFIDKYARKTSGVQEKKVKKECQSRIRAVSRRHNHSLSMYDTAEQGLGRSQKSNFSCFKKGTIINTVQKNIFEESKPCTQSFVYEKLEKSLIAHSKNRKKELYIEMAACFRESIFTLLSQNPIKKNKIRKLVEWVCQNMVNLWDGDIKKYPIKGTD